MQVKIENSANITAIETISGDGRSSNAKRWHFDSVGELIHFLIEFFM
jgi:hypothetical protein